MLADLRHCKVGPMNHDPFGMFPAETGGFWNREMHPRRIHIRDAIEGQRRLMRQSNALWSMMTCLCPQHRFAVLCEPVCRIVGNPVNASAHSFQAATLPQPSKHGILNSQGACFFRREQAIMFFSECV